MRRKRNRDLFWALTDTQKDIAALEVKVTEIESRLSLRIDHVASTAHHNSDVIADLKEVKLAVSTIRSQLDEYSQRKATRKSDTIRLTITFVLGVASAIIIEIARLMWFS